MGLLKRLGLRKARPTDPLALPPRQGYDLEDQAVRAIADVRSHTMLPYPRLVTLYQQVAHCDRAGLAGSLVECGVWRGGAVGLMALAHRAAAGELRRELHLFDSFEGIPEPDAEKDGAKAVQQIRSVGGETGGRLQAVAGFYEKFAGGPGTLEDNRALLEQRLGLDAARLHYHVGWFQDTVPRDAAAIGPIAILRLDGDWYASTRICLEHLYDRVVPGGFVIVDDYGCYEGCRRAVDEYLGERGERPFLHHVDAECRYWVKP